jgi:hypothetical protein
MRVKRKIAILGAFLFATCLTMVAGCSQFRLPSKTDFSSNWVSKEGKSKDQLYEDQKECTRDAKSVSSPAFPGEMGGGGGGDMKAFDRCMRAKGWTKE